MRDRTLKYLAFGLSVVGLIDSAYLSYIKLFNQEAACAGIGDCDVINSSPYAEIGGLPIAMLGVGGYLLILALLLLEDRSGWLGENVSMLQFGVTLVGVLYSVYLSYIELFVLHAICPFCVLSAVVMLLVFLITLVRIWLGTPELDLEEE